MSLIKCFALYMCLMSSRFSTSGCGSTQKDKIKHLKIDKFTHYQILLHKITTSKHIMENHKLRTCNLRNIMTNIILHKSKIRLQGILEIPTGAAMRWFSHEVLEPQPAIC